RGFGTALGFGLLGLVLAGAVWLGLDVIAARYAELGTVDSLVREGRVVVYRDTLRMIGANPWGIGLGTYRDKFREYQTFHPDQLFDHAHNDYLETTVEWGLPLGLVFWATILFVLAAAIRAFFRRQPTENVGI